MKASFTRRVFLRGLLVSFPAVSACCLTKRLKLYNPTRNNIKHRVYKRVINIDIETLHVYPVLSLFKINKDIVEKKSVTTKTQKLSEEHKKQMLSAARHRIPRTSWPEI